MLREEGGAGNTSGSVACQVVPQSDANRSWFNAQQKQAIANGEHGQQYSTQAYAKLKSMARMEPRYERNLPKLCTLFAKGLCNRGSACPFRHELPKDRNDPLAKQNMKDRFYGTNDPVAKKMIWKQKQIEQQRKEAEGGGSGAKSAEGDERAIATCYVRFDTRDESTMNNTISEQDVRDHFYSHGEIVSVRMHQTVGAFVEYTASEAAELAIITMNQKVINGRKILVNWARQPKRGNNTSSRSNNSSQHNQAQSSSSTAEGPILPKAPPGSSTSTSTASATSLPAGFTPSAQVAAAVKARTIANSGLAKTAAGSTSASTSNSKGLPRPNAGGGPIRRAGAGAGLRNAAPKPYYPSADPNRLGTQ